MPRSTRPSPKRVATLSRADRLAALDARVDLRRIDAPPNGGAPTKPIPAALIADVRASAARDDRELTDAYERQAVITAAADTLTDVGLGAGSDALRSANLSRRHSPYYLMSKLSRHAQARGDRAAALDWSARAFDASEAGVRQTDAPAAPSPWISVLGACRT